MKGVINKYWVQEGSLQVIASVGFTGADPVPPDGDVPGMVEIGLMRCSHFFDRPFTEERLAEVALAILKELKGWKGDEDNAFIVDSVEVQDCNRIGEVYLPCVGVVVTPPWGAGGERHQVALCDQSRVR